MTSALAASAAILVVGCASTTTAPSTPPAATVRIQQWSAAYYGSTSGGNGTLNFNGQQKKFKVSSVGVGGTGGQSVTAIGKVYNLKSLSDFPGTYKGVSNGFTIIQGKMHAKLTNDRGVVIYLAGETQGLASSTGMQSWNISFTN